MNSAALNALFARAEIFNKFEELSSQLTVEEAKIASAYLENLIKTRPIRRPESEQISPETPISASAETASVSEINCPFCDAGYHRYKDAIGFFHKVEDPNTDELRAATCGAQNAKN